MSPSTSAGRCSRTTCSRTRRWSGPSSSSSPPAHAPRRCARWRGRSRTTGTWSKSRSRPSTRTPRPCSVSWPPSSPAPAPCSPCRAPIRPTSSVCGSSCIAERIAELVHDGGRARPPGGAQPRRRPAAAELQGRGHREARFVGRRRRGPRRHRAPSVPSSRTSAGRSSTPARTESEAPSAASPSRPQASGRRRGQLQFHDLLVLARALLRHPDHGAAVRARLHERYQRLLLDEFQDTDPIQIDLAVRIAAAEPRAASTGDAAVDAMSRSRRATSSSSETPSSRSTASAVPTSRRS